MSGEEANSILGPNVYQALRVLQQRDPNVFLVELFNARQIRGMRVPSQKRAYTTTSSEEADGEPSEKRHD
jgi:hypothetical protein